MCKKASSRYFYEGVPHWQVGGRSAFAAAQKLPAEETRKKTGEVTLGYTELGKQADVVKQRMLVRTHENSDFYFGFFARLRLQTCSPGRVDDVCRTQIRHHTSDSQRCIQCARRAGL
jgi:hypothetical protein